MDTENVKCANCGFPLQVDCEEFFYDLENRLVDYCPDCGIELDYEGTIPDDEEE